MRLDELFGLLPGGGVYYLGCAPPLSGVVRRIGAPHDARVVGLGFAGMAAVVAWCWTRR